MRERRRRRASLCCFVFCLGLAPLARADVVHLTTGRSISGEVVEEDDAQVVVKTPNGRLTLPRRLVERIERQDEGRTLLAMARERAKAGAYEEAEALYERAAEVDDADLAERAREELADLRARVARAKSFRRPPSTPLDLPDGSAGEPLVGDTLQDQLDRARRALEDDDFREAQRLLAPLARANPDNLDLRYLHGRALEISGRDDPAAREEYLAVLGPRFAGDRRPVAWLGELARRALAGEEVGPTSAGAARRWERVATRHFTIFHPLERLPGWVADEAEEALDVVLETLDVKRREVRLSGRIQVFLYADRQAYMDAEGLELAGGHAQRFRAPDGWLVQIRSYAQRSFFVRAFRHEVAHAVLFHVAGPRLPRWAGEGAATLTEPPRDRAHARRFAYGARTHDELPGVLEFMKDGTPRGDTREAVTAYYGQAEALFAALVEHAGSPREALELAEAIGARGPEPALREARIRLESLEATFDRLLERHAEIR